MYDNKALLRALQCAKSYNNKSTCIYNNTYYKCIKPICTFSKRAGCALSGNVTEFFRVNRSTKCSFHPTVDVAVAVAAALLAAVAAASELKCEVDRACHQGFSARAERDALSNMYTDVF
jgi:hypothetical protein